MKAFKLQIVTPEGMYFDGECTQVTVKSTEGGVSILAGHIPYVTTLDTDGWCRVYDGDNKSQAYCSGGMLTVSKDVTRIVASVFHWEE